MMGIMGTAPSSMSAVIVCNLPSGTSEVHLADYFGRFGRIMKDRTSGGPMVRLYRDKITQKLTGDAIVAFEDQHAAEAAVEWINNTELNGNIVSVSVTEGAEFLNLVAPSSTIENPTTHVEPGYETDSYFAGDAGGCGVKCEGIFGGAQGPVDLDGGKRKGRVDGKPWQQDGDWPCPNSSCVNINFAFRGVCNRCGSARPAVDLASGGGVAGGVRGRIRGANDACGRGRGSGGPPGLFGPNDWSCPMCGNINWAKRLKCNICNTSKPGCMEGGARDGRAGGFKEFDEAEIEESKRRRRDQEDDGEMYDEFGNLKKKFRTKAKLGNALDTTGIGIGVGKAGWDRDFGFVESCTRERSRDRSDGLPSRSDRRTHEYRRGFSSLKTSRHDPNDEGYETKRGEP